MWRYFCLGACVCLFVRVCVCVCLCMFVYERDKMQRAHSATKHLVPIFLRLIGELWQKWGCPARTQVRLLYASTATATGPYSQCVCVCVCVNRRRGRLLSGRCKLSDLSSLVRLITNSERSKSRHDDVLWNQREI